MPASFAGAETPSPWTLRSSSSKPRLKITSAATTMPSGPVLDCEDVVEVTHERGERHADDHSGEHRDAAEVRHRLLVHACARQATTNRLRRNANRRTSGVRPSVVRNDTANTARSTARPRDHAYRHVVDAQSASDFRADRCDLGLILAADERRGG